jgi:sulfatase modifying factor 1
MNAGRRLLVLWYASCGGEHPPLGVEEVRSAAAEAPAERAPSTDERPKILMPSCADGMAMIGPRSKEVVPAFCLDRFETTVREWTQCVEAGRCPWTRPKRLANGPYTVDLGDPDLPINYVRHEDAVTYCAWRGKRLPTLWEWRWAYRSAREDYDVPWGEWQHVDPPFIDGVKQPVGDNYIPGPVCRAVLDEPSRKQACPVGTNAGDQTEQGVMDMAGNVTEWTSTHTKDIPGRSNAGYAVGGGAFMRSPREFDESVAMPGVGGPLGIWGVRCAADLAARAIGPDGSASPS